jgi:hypothetical protein
MNTQTVDDAARSVVDANRYIDSTVPIGGDLAVYMSGTATQLGDAEVERGLEVFSRESLADGASAWRPADVTGSAEVRLYRAVVSECFLGRANERECVSADYLTGS